MDKKIILCLFATSLLVLFAAPFVIHAQTLPFPYWGKNPGLLPCTGTGCVNSCQLIQLAHRLTFLGISLAIFALAPAFIAFGGIMIMVGRGSPEGLSRGKKIVKSALVGLALAAGAFLIVNTFFLLVVKPLGGNAKFTDWKTIECPVRPGGAGRSF